MNSSTAEKKSSGAGHLGGFALITARDAARADGSRHVLSVDFSLTRRALGLAIGSLLLAGCFSLLLIVGRMPVFSE